MPRPYGRHECVTETALVWPDPAAGRVVGATASRFSWSRHFHRLLDVGGVSGSSLLFRTIPLAILLAGALGLLTARPLRAETRLVAGVAAVLTGAADSLGARRLSLDVLLLSRRLLQSVLGRSAVVHRQRTSETLSRRKLFPAHHAKRSSLSHVRCAGVHSDRGEPRAEAALVHRRRSGQRYLRHRRGYPSAGDQRR